MYDPNFGPIVAGHPQKMHVILAIDTSLSMFRKTPKSPKRYIDITIEALEHFIDYTSDKTHNTVNEIAIVNFSKELNFIAPFELGSEQLEFPNKLKETIKKSGPGGSCQLTENLLKLEKVAKHGLGDDSFIDIFLITDKKIGSSPQHLEFLEDLDLQTRLFVFYFDESIEDESTNQISCTSKFIQKLARTNFKEKTFFDKICTKNEANFTLPDLLSEKMIHRYTTHIAELIVSVNLGSLEDKCTLFPQPRTIALEQNSELEIIGFTPLNSLMGLPIISRHCLIPRGTDSEPNLLALMTKTTMETKTDPNIALVQIKNKGQNHLQNIYGFVTLMNFKTTSTNYQKCKDMQMCLLLVDDISWLGNFDNLAPNSRLQARTENIIRNPQNSLNKYFPIQAGFGAFGNEQQKSYCNPLQSQIWKNGNNVAVDYSKLVKATRKLPHDDENKHIGLGFFTQQMLIFD